MLRSPLDAVHRRAGAKLVPFGGWEMPLEFQGTVAEHLACRDGAAMFDVSHLGTVRVDGSDAYDRLQRTLTNDLDKIGPGRAQYTHLLEPDGSVADDIIVWWHPAVAGAEPVFDVMPNASNTERVLRAIGGVDTTADRAIIAVQGPDARRLLAEVVPEVADVRRFGVARTEWHGAACTLAGTGYTGEDGVEIATPPEVAADMWESLVEVGVVQAGLGARDTLRLEAGLPLHGHELGPGITPLQAGLGWVVAFGKPVFVGKDALVAERERGVHRRLVGIATEGRRPPRAGCAIVVDGARVGEVTSGNFSPVLGHGIALGFAPPEITAGDRVGIDVRGSLLAGEVVALPFVKR
jgi:aminomethyltransferase